MHVIGEETSERHGQSASARLQSQQDRRLEPIGVLIFIHQYMVPPPADVVGQQRIADRLCPMSRRSS